MNKALSLKIREMDERDIEEIQEIARENSLEKWSDAHYRNELKSNSSLILAGESDNQVIGFLSAGLITNLNLASTFLNKNPDKFSPDRFLEVEIHNIAVGAKFQGRGIGTGLLENLIERIERIGVYNISSNIKIWLELRKSNEQALKFYKQNKFRTQYLRKNFYSHPTEDAIVMKLEIEKKLSDTDNLPQKNKLR